MGIEWRSVGRPRGMPFLLALLALALQVVVPPGYMVGGRVRSSAMPPRPASRQPRLNSPSSGPDSSPQKRLPPAI